MKRNEQILLGSLAVIGLIVGFWLLVLSPKRHDAAQLQDDINQLQSSLTQAQQEVSAGQQAQKSFRVNYRRMVVLGKAVPADSEQTSLLVQVQDLASSSGVDFQSISLGDAGSATTPAPAPTTSTTPTDSSTSTSSTEATSSSATTSTSGSTSMPATEASASLLPIGAGVGPAGLPVMPYDMTFTGNFFQIADFMKHLDSLVHIRGDQAYVRGRLMTVDGFTLTPSSDDSSANPTLTADLSVTTFLTPADQGITAGATPSGPSDSTSTLTGSTSTDSTTSSTTTSTSTETSTSP